MVMRVGELMPAYHNDPARKANLIARLKAHAAAGDIQRARLAWKNGKGSLVGCLIHDTSFAVWQQQTGLPKALGCALDTIAVRFATPQLAAQFAVQWLQAIPVGCDLLAACHALLVWLLTDPEHGVIRDAAGDALRQVIEQVAGLHRRSLSGDRPPAAQWRDARVAATTMADAQQTELQKAIALTVESAAWDPVTAVTVISDTVSGWTSACVKRDRASQGWSEQEETRTNAMLMALWQDARASSTPEPNVDPMTLFDRHHPAEAARLRSARALERDTPAAAARVLGNALIELMRDRSVTGTLQVV
jgi:hypothetical protein